MAIETRTTIKYEYECINCANDYIEQRNPGEGQFVTQCPICGGAFKTTNTTESIYDVEVPDAITEEPTE